MENNDDAMRYDGMARDMEELTLSCPFNEIFAFF